MYQDKMRSLEEGKYHRIKENSDGRTNACSYFAQVMKVVLYIELVLAIAWVGCIFLSNYYGEVPYNSGEGSYGIPEADDNQAPLIRGPPSVMEGEQFIRMNVIKANSEGKENSKESITEKAPDFVHLEEMTTIDSAMDSHEDIFDQLDDDWQETILTADPIWTEKAASIEDYNTPFSNSMGNASFTDGYITLFLDFKLSDMVERHLTQLQSNMFFETDSESDSSDSSPENDSARDRKSNKDNISCPPLLNANGNRINDPAEVIRYLKDYWFQLLIDTPSPDCHESQSILVTVNPCGNFVANCAATNVSKNPTTNEIADTHAVKHSRTVRNVASDETTAQACELSQNATRYNVQKLTTHLTLGDSSEATINKIQLNLLRPITALTFRLIVEQAMRGENKTDEQWRTAIQELRKNISELMGPNYRQQLSESAPLTQEAADILRDIIESNVFIYTKCRDTITSEEGRQAMEILAWLVDREKCLIGRNSLQTQLDTLAADFVPGESSNSAVEELRKKFKTMIELLSRKMISLESSDPSIIPTGTVNVTDEQWRTYVANLKEELVKISQASSNSPALDGGTAPTEKQTNDFRRIIEYYMRENRQCNRMNLFELVGLLKGMERIKKQESQSQSVNRKKRWVMADPLPKPITISCWIDKPSAEFLEERKDRLEAWNDVNVTKNPDLQQFIDKLEVEINAEHSTEVQVQDAPTKYRPLVMIANLLLFNSSSSALRKESYELMRDTALEMRKLETSPGSDDWSGYDIIKMQDNLTHCLNYASEYMTPDFLFMIFVKAAEVTNLHYSELDYGHSCGTPYKPVHGTFEYVGEGPEPPGVKRWRHIIEAVVNFFFKIRYPKSLGDMRCDNGFDDGGTTELSPPAKESTVKDVVKRSIGYPNRLSPNSLDEEITVVEDHAELQQKSQDVLRGLDHVLQENLFDKMEILSSHIDRLHEHYMEFNELNDDYMSKEWPVHSEVK